MNLAFKYPIIYWNTACLITDTGGSEDVNEGASNNYDKLADGINKMKNEGIIVYPPDINKASFTFKPDEESNHIVFGLRGVLGIGSEVIDEIISKRPFISLQDLMTRTDFNKQVMVSLIKSGALDSFGERKDIMKEYLWENCDKKKNLTMQNLMALMSYNLLPTDKEYKEPARVFNFNRYLKAVCKNGILDERAMAFLCDISHEEIINSDMSYDVAAWKKIYDSYMLKYREYITNNKAELLDKLNQTIFQAEWDKYALGNYSSWEMETICCYYHEHELKNINKEKYSITNYFDLPEEPIVDKEYTFRDKQIKLFKLDRICGTCISKNKSHATIKLLTLEGVVEVRFGKEYFSLYDRVIKVPAGDGKMKIGEHSWFDRGNLLMVQGIRTGDQFVAKKYKNSLYPHRLYRITSIENNGDITLQSERLQGDAEDGN